MSESLFTVLNYINEGIIILNEELEILFWNDQMVHLTKITSEQAIDTHLFEVLPRLKQNYLQQAFNSSLEKGYRYFFAAAMHNHLITDDAKCNLRISRFEHQDKKCLMIECVDVTSQFTRIHQLKEYANRLYTLNQELLKKEEEIKRLAYFDKLTGVANRALFYNLANKYLAQAKRNQQILGLMFIDVDKLKCINDNYGHHAGDHILAQVAQILKTSIRKSDLVARYGGDEFLILLPNLEDYDSYKMIASRIASPKHRLIVNDDLEIELSFSIGVSFYPRDGHEIEELICKADQAMYCAKKSGGNQCVQALQSPSSP